MKVEAENIVGKVVAHDYRTAEVFQSFGIDFCCKGNRSIAEVCQNGHVDMDKLLKSLKEALAEKKEKTIDFQSWFPDLLADYIEKTHHRYVKKRLPVLKSYLEKIAKVHGDRHPELHEVANLFMATAGELTAHMKKEELILFPYIRKQVVSESLKSPAAAPHFGTVENPIRMMMHEHDAEGERFRKIAALTHNYIPPADACNTYKTAFALLKEFEEDLHLHIHLENNILFPKSIELERLNNE